MSDNLAKCPKDLVAIDGELKQTAEYALQLAKKQGASDAEIVITIEAGYSVNVRMGAVETVEHHRGKSVDVVVFYGKKKGSASSSDTSRIGIEKTISAACEIAKVTTEDPYAGLADATHLAQTIPDLDLYHPWVLSVEEAIEKMKACESAGLSHDPRLKNSDGASLSTYSTLQLYANSHGFLAGYPSSRHDFNCVLIAKEQDAMQRDYDFSVARSADDLDGFETVAKRAGARTVARLGGKKIKSCETSVIFASELVGGLLASFINAISGHQLYRKTSFLLDHLGQRIFPKNIDIFETPHRLKGLGSSPFDAEGVATSEKHFVKKGVLSSYILNSYSARKLGLVTTGNAGGVFNLSLSHDGDDDRAALLRKMGTGLLVTELMGQGANIVTGDYSRGASGFWVERGEIQYPVQEITIAGNLKDMFQNIKGVANDVERRGNLCSGSMLIEPMTIAGI